MLRMVSCANCAVNGTVPKPVKVLQVSLGRIDKRIVTQAGGAANANLCFPALAVAECPCPNRGLAGGQRLGAEKDR